MRILVRLSMILISFACLLSNAAGNEAVNLMNKKKWGEAEKVAKESKDTALIKLILSQKFLDTNFSNNFEEVIKFLENNPNWPQLAKIQETAESYIDVNTDKQVIVKWFNKNIPKTGNGYKFYAYAAAKLITDPATLIPVIKDGWVYGDFTKEEEQKYLINYGKYLSEEDHIRRLDEHLWKSDFAEVKRSLKLVNNGYRNAFTTGIALAEKNPESEKLFKNIPEKYLTSSIIFHYLTSQKSQEPTKFILSLMQKVKPNLIHSVEWTKLQIYWAREFIYLKDYNSAYKAINTAFPVDQDDIREVHWHAGWIALRFLNKPILAKKHFNDFLSIVKTPISLSRGYYWLGKCYAKNGEPTKALEFYKKATQFSYTFYGQLASVELKENKIVLPVGPKIDISHRNEVENSDVVKAAKLLLADNKIELAKTYAKSAVENAKSKGEIALLVKIIADSSNNPYHTAGIAKIAAHNHVFLKDYIFPTPYNIASKPIEASLTYAIIKQESVFDPKAISNKNAMGLMQLVKDTACSTAKSLAMKCDVARLTKDYKYNIKLGSSHFRDLLKKFGGSYVLSIANYNTAPKNVNKWIDLFGDPREIKRLDRVIDWLELIPFAETRNYVQRVLENTQVYRVILNKDSNLKLKRDLLNL